MKDLNINVELEMPNIHEKIVKRFENKEYPKVSLNKDGIIKISVDEKDEESITTISNILSSYVYEEIEPQLIKEEVDFECLGLSEIDIDNVTERALWRILNSEESNERRLEELNEDIYEGLINHGTFNLQGYLDFKFNMRRMEIKEYVNMVIAEFFEDDVNSDFVNLINQFISLKKPQTDLIHTVLLPEGGFKLITSDLKEIDLDGHEDLVDDLNLDEMEDWHVILGTLLALAPEGIIIHTSEDVDPYISQMLSKVYGTRLAICYGCDFCKIIKEKNEE